MNIQVRLRVEGRDAATGTIKIDNRKLEGLTQEEVEQAVEIVVTQWANDRIEMDWEADDLPDEEAEE